jgi:hypothetical protein
MLLIGGSKRVTTIGIVKNVVEVLAFDLWIKANTRLVVLTWGTSWR